MRNNRNYCRRINFMTSIKYVQKWNYILPFTLPAAGLPYLVLISTALYCHRPVSNFGSLLGIHITDSLLEFDAWHSTLHGSLYHWYIFLFLWMSQPSIFIRNEVLHCYSEYYSIIIYLYTYYPNIKQKTCFSCVWLSFFGFRTRRVNGTIAKAPLSVRRSVIRLYFQNRNS